MDHCRTDCSVQIIETGFNVDALHVNSDQVWYSATVVLIQMRTWGF